MAWLTDKIHEVGIREKLTREERDEYVEWMRRFWEFTKRKSPIEWTEVDARGFLSLFGSRAQARDRRAAERAVLFCLQKVLGLPIGDSLAWIAPRIDEAMARKNLQPRTRDTYTSWIKSFSRYLNDKHPSTWSEQDVMDYLTFMCTGEEPYSTVAQKQAKNAIAFFFAHVLVKEVGDFSEYLRIPEHRRPPTVLARSEIEALFANINPRFRFRAQMLYNCGLRINECITMRVQDLDVPNRSVVVMDGKGGVHRRVALPNHLVETAERHIAWRRKLHDTDLAEGAGLVKLPKRYAKKFPSACRMLGWQYLFPSSVIRESHRWYCGDTHVLNAIKEAARKAGIIKRVTCHTLRHSSATHLLQSGAHIRTVQEWLGHKSVETTMIYLHVEAAGARSFVNQLVAV